MLIAKSDHTEQIIGRFEQHYERKTAVCALTKTLSTRLINFYKHSQVMGGVDRDHNIYSPGFLPNRCSASKLVISDTVVKVCATCTIARSRQ